MTFWREKQPLRFLDDVLKGKATTQISKLLPSDWGMSVVQIIGFVDYVSRIGLYGPFVLESLKRDNQNHVIDRCSSS